MGTYLLDIECNPHLELAASESFVSDNERAWLRFVRKVEHRIGHGLDGNQDVDGFSLDEAYGAFEGGETAADYAAEVIDDDCANAAAFGPALYAIPIERAS